MRRCTQRLAGLQALLAAARARGDGRGSSPRWVQGTAISPRPRSSGRSSPRASSVCQRPRSSSQAMSVDWPGTCCSRAARSAADMRRRRGCAKVSEKVVADLVGPAAVVLDDRVGDPRHGASLLPRRAYRLAGRRATANRAACCAPATATAAPGRPRLVVGVDRADAAVEAQPPGRSPAGSGQHEGHVVEGGVGEHQHGVALGVGERDRQRLDEAVGPVRPAASARRRGAASARPAARPRRPARRGSSCGAASSGSSRRSRSAPATKARNAPRARLGAPVHPGELVVLAVGVVVALLGAAVLVAHQQHRHALADDQRRHREAPHPVAQREDRRVVGRALDAAVPRAVVVVAVAVVLAVRLVVLLVVGVEVGEREAVVRGDEVDAGPGPPAAPVEDVARAEEVAGEVVDGVVVALDVGADVVAEAAVPLRPAGRERRRPDSRTCRDPSSRRSS